MNKILAAMLAVAAAAIFGCGKGPTYQSSDGKLKVDKKGDTVNYEVQTKEGKATMAVSDKGVAIPDTFPKDVPILKGAVPKMAMTQGKTELLHLYVAGSMADVAKDYQTKLKTEGWEIESTMNMGEASMVAAKKGNRKCAAMVAKDGTGVMVQLSVTQE
jgi:hypothetical protein